VSLRSDLGSASRIVDNAEWRVGGWSITMGLGLVMEW
jgi:hypothetical protein